MSPKILLEKNKERENRVSEEKERRRRKIKDWPQRYFFFTSVWGESPILAVTLFKNPALIYIFRTIAYVPKRNLI